MKQFDKEIRIAITPGQPDTIQRALQQYQQHLNDHSAFCDNRFMLEFVAQPAGLDGDNQQQGAEKRLQFNDIQDETLRSYALLAWRLGPQDWDFSECGTPGEDSELCVSEAIVFALALQYEELKSEVVRTASAMVNYARHFNDTHAIWSDDMRVFATEALFVLACHDPQYIYLLGQFLIPNWDEEHATGYSDYLKHFVYTHGWSEDVIKAYLWCDNPDFRFQMFGMEWESETHYQPLGEFLRAHPERYEWFKQALCERLLTQPMMLQDEYTGPDEIDPVLELYITLLPRNGELCEEEALDRHREQTFVVASLEDEALDLQQQILAMATQPLVCHAPSACYETEDEQYEGDLLRSIKPLVLAMQQGEKLWSYVLRGSHRQTLEGLTEVQLVEHAKHHANAFYLSVKDTLRSGESNQDFHRRWWTIARDILYEILCDDEDAEYIEDVMPSMNLYQRQQQCARLFEVFYYALGQCEFDDQIRCLLVEDWELLTAKEYFSRYSSVPESQINQRLLTDVSAQFCNMHSRLQRINFEHADRLLGDVRELANPNCWPKQQGVFSVGQYTLMAYLLYRDWRQQIGDAHTQALAKTLNHTAHWQALFAHLCKNLNLPGNGTSNDPGMTEQTLKQFADYFCAAQPELNQQQVIDLINQYAHREECVSGNMRMNLFSEHQRGYRFLSDREDDYQRCLLICFWLRQLPLPCQVQADRIWQLMIALAPVRVARLVLQIHSDSEHGILFENDLKGIDHYKALERAGIDNGYLLALQLSQHHSEREEEESALRYFLNMETLARVDDDDSYMMGKLKREQGQQLQRGLRYINESIKTETYRFLALAHPRFGYAHNAELQQDFRRVLSRTIKLNLKRLKWSALLNKLQDDFAVREYDCSAEEFKAKPIKISPDYRPLNEFYARDKIWLRLWLVQDCGDHLAVLGGSDIIDTRARKMDLSQLSGVALVVDADQDANALQQRAYEMTDPDFRQQHISDAVMAYVEADANADLNATLTLLQNTLTTDSLKLQAPEYSMTGLANFIWLLDEKRRNRLAQLFLNLNYSGFELVAQTPVGGYLDKRVEEGEMSLQERLSLYHDDEDYEEAATEHLLNWLGQIDICPEHLLLYCVKHDHRGACQQWVADLAHRGELKKASGFLSAKQRAILMEMLAQRAQTRPILGDFIHDESRAVRDVIARYLSV